ncbi:MAG: ASCH domain-containing protein [Mariprofundaceae bacterium]
MMDLPEKTCDISRLVRHPKLVTAALDGKKTEQRRDGVYAYPDEEFELDGVAFVLTALKRQNLGDMTDMNAQAEGYPSLEAYKSLILKMHKGMQWKNEAQVWVHCFERKVL